MKKPKITKPILGVILICALIAAVFGGVQLSNLLTAEFTATEELVLTWNETPNGEYFVRSQLYEGYGVDITNPGSGTHTAVLKLRITCAETLLSGCLSIQHDRSGTWEAIEFIGWTTKIIQGDVGTSFTIGPLGELHVGLTIMLSSTAPLVAYTADVWVDKA